MERNGNRRRLPRGRLLAWLAALALLAAGCGDDAQEPAGDPGAEDGTQEVEPPPEDPFVPDETDPGPGEELGPTDD